MRWSVLSLALLPLAAACAPQGDAATTSPGFPDRLRALGTEPFWALDIDRGAIAYSTAEQPTPVAGRAARSAAGRVLTLAGTLAGKPVTARLIPATCSDGMSDRVYPYAVTIQLGGETLNGCAYPPDLAENPAGKSR